MRKRRVAIYVRVSTAEQAKEGYSIQEQIKRLTAYCEAMGWVVVKIYIDAGLTGSDMHRSGLNEMVEDIDTFDTVLVYKLDRLSRSQKDTLYLIEDVFLANDVDFVSATESFDTSTPFGRAMVGMLAVFAQLERENIKERMSIGKQARAEKGLWHGSKWTPIGYDYNKETGKLEVNEYEKMQVQKIYSMYLSGKSLTAITKQLNADGLKHKHGKWSHKTVKHVLTSKAYLGYTKSKNEWFLGEHAAIIAQKEYDRVQKRLEERKNNNARYSNKYNSALGGMCYCANCGAKYTRRAGHKHKNGEYTYYYKCYSRANSQPEMVKDPNCKNKIYRKEVLEELIFEEVRRLALHPEAIRNIQKENAGKDNSKEIHLIREKIDDLNNQLSNLVDLFAVGKMNVTLIESKTAVIQDEKETLVKRLEQLKQTDKPTVLETHELARSLVRLFEVGTDDEIRTALNELISEIIIDGDDITIHWKFA